MRSGSAALFAVIGLALAAPAGLMWKRLSSSSLPGPPPRAGEGGPTSTSTSTATPASAPTADPEPPLPSYASVDPRTAKACLAGMILIDGDYCPAVAHFCEEWVGDDPTAAPGFDVAGRPGRRCRRYKNLLVCEGRPSHLHVCIDRYEYPNLAGSPPATMTSYRDAARACAAEGKRLCESDEWMFACEGPRTWPYPYGIERSPSACNIDRPRRAPNPEALARPADVSLELERLDQRVPSGSRPGCASPFGVFDLSGNVAEWVHERRGRPGAGGSETQLSDTALAGGDWDRAPATCRRLDASHGADHASYATGFRCCADALDGVRARRLLSEGARLSSRRPLVP